MLHRPDLFESDTVGAQVFVLGGTGDGALVIELWVAMLGETSSFSQGR